MLPNKQLAMAAGIHSHVKTVRNGVGRKQGGPGFRPERAGRCRLFFRRGIPVSIPSATFQLEAASGKYLLGFTMAFGTLDRFGIHPHQFFGNMTTFALEFVNRHHSFLSESGMLHKRLGCLRWPVFLGQFSSVFESCQDPIATALWTPMGYGNRRTRSACPNPPIAFPGHQWLISLYL